MKHSVTAPRSKLAGFRGRCYGSKAGTFELIKNVSSNNAIHRFLFSLFSAFSAGRLYSKEAGHKLETGTVNDWRSTNFEAEL